MLYRYYYVFGSPHKSSQCGPMYSYVKSNGGGGNNQFIRKRANAIYSCRASVEKHLRPGAVLFKKSSLPLCGGIITIYTEYALVKINNIFIYIYSPHTAYFSWQNGTYSSLPYLAMWVFSMVASHIADMMISSERFTHTTTRKIVNTIGKYQNVLFVFILTIHAIHVYINWAFLIFSLAPTSVAK